ncbi:MAG: thiol-disulfide oxidoreductase ResA [Bacilli bacterium]
MNKRTLQRVAILAILIGLVAYAVYSNFIEKRDVIVVGGNAPDFSLVATDGTQYKLSELQGKQVMVNFWGTWCKPCEREMPVMRDFYNQYSSKGIEILAVNAGETELAVDAFKTKYDLPFPLLIDVNRDVMDAYFINPLPISFFIDANGVVTDIHQGTLTPEMMYSYFENAGAKLAS